MLFLLPEPVFTSELALPTPVSLGHGCRLWDDRRIRTGYAAHNRAILKRIANKRLAAAWNKDYLCPLSGLKPKPV